MLWDVILKENNYFGVVTLTPLCIWLHRTTLSFITFLTITPLVIISFMHKYFKSKTGHFDIFFRYEKGFIVEGI